jgi:hypothetical protein
MRGVGESPVRAQDWCVALAGTGRILDAVNVGGWEMTVSSFPGLALERRGVAVYRSCRLAEERCR